MRVLDMADVGYDIVREEVETALSGDGIIGLPYPWRKLNKGTQGLREGNFVVVYATPKTGKTNFCLHIATNLFVRHNLRVAVIC